MRDVRAMQSGGCSHRNLVAADGSKNLLGAVLLQRDQLHLRTRKCATQLTDLAHINRSSSHQMFACEQLHLRSYKVGVWSNVGAMFFDDRNVELEPKLEFELEMEVGG